MLSANFGNTVKPSA